MKANIEKYRACARRGMQFLMTLFNADGSFKRTEHMLTGMYKAPLALLTSGYEEEARLAIGYIKNHFFEEGNFNCGVNDIFQPLTDNYRNGWLCWGSHCLGLPDLYEPGADYLESCINPDFGGLPGRMEYHIRESILDWGSSALGTVALTKIGRLDAARQCARFFENMLDCQPEPDEQLYLRRAWDGRLYHLFPSHQATEFMVEFQTPFQLFWYFGAAISALGYLYQATNESRWLNTAEQIFNLTRKCRSEVYRSLTSAKIGWGCSVLYTASGKPEYGETMVTIADHVVATQEADGGWVRRPFFNSWNEQPPVLGIDVSLERCVWLNLIAQSLVVDND